MAKDTKEHPPAGGHPQPKPTWAVKIHPEPEAVVEAWDEKQAVEVYCDQMAIREYEQGSLTVQRTA